MAAIEMTGDTGRFPLRNLSVRRFLGIRELDQRFKGRLTAVVGPNASGKSSLAAAIRGCMSSNCDPLFLGERQNKLYAHNNATNCSVEVELLDDEVKRSWEPNAKKISGSVAYPQKPLVIGTDTPFRLRTDKEINDFWDNVVTVKIKASQVIEHCRAQLKSYPPSVGNSLSSFIDDYMRNFPEGECNRDEIRKFHASLRSARLAVIAKFNSVKSTNVPGNVKGSNLMPYLTFDIPAEYDGASADDVKQEVEKLKHDLNHKYTISSADTWARYRENRAKLEEAEKELAAIEAKVTEHKPIYEVKVRQNDKKLDNLKEFVESAMKNVEKLRAEEAVAELLMDCPECGVWLSYDPHTKSLWKPDDSREVKESKRLELIEDWEKKRKEAEGDISNLIEAKKKDDKDVAEMIAQMDKARRNVDVFKALVSNKSDIQHECNGSEVITMDEYKEKVNRISELMAIADEVAARRTAQLASYRAQALDILMDIIDPGGVAARQRARGFEYIQSTIGKIESASETSFKKVTINEGGRILIGGTPHALASKSERIWVNWLIQCTFAILYSGKVSHQLMVVDEIDIFDEGQNRSFAKSIDYILDQVKNSQIVAMGTKGPETWNTTHRPNIVEIK